MTDLAHGDAPPEAPGSAPENWVPVERRFLGFDKATIVPTVVILIFVLALGTWLPNITSSSPTTTRRRRVTCSTSARGSRSHRSPAGTS